MPVRRGAIDCGVLAGGRLALLVVLSALGIGRFSITLPGDQKETFGCAACAR